MEYNMSTKKKTTVTLDGLAKTIVEGYAEKWEVSNSHAAKHMIETFWGFVHIAQEAQREKSAMLMFNPDEFAQKLLNPPPSEWGGAREGAGNPHWKKD
jgi:hypothetical protein